jgi:anionic cell wall polymer biosynthesis LytR-Cps2A-Psr (LCP) family protein
MDRVTPRFVRKRRSVDRLTLILVAVFAILAIATALVAFFWARSFFSSWKLTSLDGSPPISAETTNNNQVVLPENGANVPFQPSESGPSSQPWDGKTRVTILLMGLDYRDCETEAGFQDCDTSSAARTDSMMLVSIDPVSKSVGVLSIPRDLWV